VPLGRFTSKPSYFTELISGRTSKRALYKKFVPAASFWGSMLGCESGCTFFSVSAFCRVSSTSLRVTSSATRSP
jgi:hypothetical protein